LRLPKVAVCVCVVAVVCGGACKKPPPESGSISITSTPASGVEVTLAGRAVGQTPVEVDDLMPGQYSVRGEKEGHRPAARSVEIRAGERVAINLQLTQISGYVVVESDPPGAQVFLEPEELLGETPFACSVPVGRQTLRFKAEDYKDELVEVNIERRKTINVKGTLTGLPVEVTVESDPPRSEVFIDERRRGLLTPATFKLDPGLHTIAVEARGYAREERDIQMEPNQKLALSFELHEGDVPPRMLRVPAGEFKFGCIQGSRDELPLRTVYLETFYIDKYEVTNARYRRFDPSHVFAPEFANHPVVNVDWYAAEKYAEWAGKRLPTEQEWEKAARGTDGRSYPWGNSFDKGKCNVKGSLAAMLMAVGEYPSGRSPYGCYDMAGNVWEWIADWYGPYPGNKELEDVYGQRFKVLRGGSFNTVEYRVRCSNRHYDLPDTRKNDYGFRCVKTP